MNLGVGRKAVIKRKIPVPDGNRTPFVQPIVALLTELFRQSTDTFMIRTLCPQFACSDTALITQCSLRPLFDLRFCNLAFCLLYYTWRGVLVITEATPKDMRQARRLVSLRSVLTDL